jgi:hypothetical protein
MQVMKHTKIAGFVLGFGLMLVVWVTETEALVPVREVNDLLLKPTATPTSISIKKVIDPNLVRVLTTNTPTLVPPTPITTVATPTDIPTLTQTSVSPTESVLGEQIEPTVEPTATNTPTTSTPTPAVKDTASNNNLTFWFLLATVGLLAIIIVIQAWPSKEKEDKEEDSN